MIERKNGNIVVIGRGVSGLLSAIRFSEEYSSVYIISTQSELHHSIMADERDKHAHVCVAAALEKIKEFVPSIVAQLKSNGFYIGDPGRLVKWSTDRGPLPVNDSNCQCGFGSYRSFLQTLQDIIRQKQNIHMKTNVNNLKFLRSRIEFNCDSKKQKIIKFKSLIITDRTSGSEFFLLKENNVKYEMKYFYGYCCYHSLDIKLRSPLNSQIAFISEAHPKYKSMSFLYVPKTAITGVLTIGNFGAKIKINSPGDLQQVLSQWKETIPEDFIDKIESVSKQSNHTQSKVTYRKIDHQKSPNIFLVGDALLNSPPYTGLGFLVATESLKCVSRCLKNPNLDFNQIFEESTKPIFYRIRRYERFLSNNQYSDVPKQIPADTAISLLSTTIPKEWLYRLISKYIYRHAMMYQSQDAAKYLTRKFHMVQEQSFDLLKLLIKLALSRKQLREIDK